MDRLLIKPTKSTPEVIFEGNTGKFRIIGSSYPENAYDFFHPIIDWIDNFVNKKLNDQVELKMKMHYFDTSSSKCLLVILEKLEKFYKNGNKVNVIWLYDEDDYDNIESAEELFIGLNMPREFIKE